MKYFIIIIAAGMSATALAVNCSDIKPSYDELNALVGPCEPHYDHNNLSVNKTLGGHPCLVNRVACTMNAKVAYIVKVYDFNGQCKIDAHYQSNDKIDYIDIEFTLLETSKPARK